MSLAIVLTVTSVQLTAPSVLIATCGKPQCADGRKSVPLGSAARCPVIELHRLLLESNPEYASPPPGVQVMPPSRLRPHVASITRFEHQYRMFGYPTVGKPPAGFAATMVWWSTGTLPHATGFVIQVAPLSSE